MPSIALENIVTHYHVPLSLASIVLVIPFLYVIYCRYLHPLAKYPGPWLATISPIWKVRAAYNGTIHTDLLALHRQYGPFVRFGVDELSISSPQAIKEIYAHGSAFAKTDYYHVWQDRRQGPNLFTYRNDTDHATERRLVANAYSLTALLELEPYVDNMILLMLDKLRGFGNAKVDMAFWLQAYAFDVIGEIAFGNPFNFMATGSDIGNQMARLREWLRKRFLIGMIPWFFPIYQSLLFRMISPAAQAEYVGQVKTQEFARIAVQKRMHERSDRRDMLSRFLAIKQPSGEPISVDGLVRHCESYVHIIN